MSTRVGSRSAAHVAAFSCLSMIIVAMLVLHDHGSENLQVELQSSSVGSDSSMQDMQKEAERQLVDAAKRKMHALSHKVNAVKLSSSAREDQTKAELLKKKAILGRRQEDLDKADKAVQDAQKELKHIKEEEKTSSSTSDNDSAKADKAKEDIMNLESEAGTFNEKAQEEEQKIVLVKAAAAKEAAKIPELFKSARNAEDEADKLKLVARNKMQDSKRKSEEAFRLDKVAEEKEREAHMIRKKLISILEEKTKMLYTKEQDASRQKVYAKKAAKEAAKEAQKLAALAAAKARLAKKAEDQLNRDIGEEREAEATVNDGINNVKMKENAVRDAKRAFEDLKRKAGGGREEEENDEAPEVDEKIGKLKDEATKIHHQVLEARREVNLLRAARHTESLRGHPDSMQEGRKEVERVLNHKEEEAPEREEGARGRNQRDWGSRRDAGAGSRGFSERREQEERRGGGSDRVGEDENGHLVVKERAAGGPLDHRLKEDGHYSTREENFKKALAEAYRSGYENEDVNFKGAGGRGREDRRDGEGERGSEGGAGGRDDRMTSRRERDDEEEAPAGRWRTRREAEEGGSDMGRGDRGDERRERISSQEGDRRERSSGGDTQNANLPRGLEDALRRDTGRGPYKRMHEALTKMATATPGKSKPPPLPHFTPSRDWNHFWHRG